MRQNVARCAGKWLAAPEGVLLRQNVARCAGKWLAAPENSSSRAGKSTRSKRMNGGKRAVAGRSLSKTVEMCRSSSKIVEKCRNLSMSAK